jgi:hypothetical protein
MWTTSPNAGDCGTGIVFRAVFRKVAKSPWSKTASAGEVSSFIES